MERRGRELRVRLPPLAGKCLGRHWRAYSRGLSVGSGLCMKVDGTRAGPSSPRCQAEQVSTGSSSRGHGRGLIAGPVLSPPPSALSGRLPGFPLSNHFSNAGPRSLLSTLSLPLPSPPLPSPVSCRHFVDQSLMWTVLHSGELAASSRGAGGATKEGHFPLGV